MTNYRGQKVKIIKIKDDYLNSTSAILNKKIYKTDVFIEKKDECKVLDDIFVGKGMFNRKEKVNAVTFKSDKPMQTHCICRLYQGYRHQVRVHLSSIGLPIQGDALYNMHYIKKMGTHIEKKIANNSYPLELYATKLTFPSPYNYSINSNSTNKLFKELLSFSLPQLDKKNL